MGGGGACAGGQGGGGGGYWWGWVGFVPLAQLTGFVGKCLCAQRQTLLLAWLLAGSAVKQMLRSCSILTCIASRREQAHVAVTVRHPSKPDMEEAAAKPQEDGMCGHCPSCLGSTSSSLLGCGHDAKPLVVGTHYFCLFATVPLGPLPEVLGLAFARGMLIAKALGGKLIEKFLVTSSLLLFGPLKTGMHSVRTMQRVVKGSWSGRQVWWCLSTQNIKLV